ncbi:MAG TPA: EamA family transporter, partial [Azoarcus taiwanensis]|nr:EamA family transporter [Azoarcus taiwanensis]
MNPASDRAEAGRGVAYGLAAYGIWGCFPLFFSLFEGIPSWEVLIHRIIWCCVFLVLLVSLLGRWQPVVDALAQPARLGRVFACALLIGANWAIFIYAVETRQVFQSSLGYFMTPLVNVALGILVLKERMAKLQAWAV